METLRPRALLIDVIGTVVNWYYTVSSYLESCASFSLNDPSASIASMVRLNVVPINWGDFAKVWRERYLEFSRTFDDEAKDFETLDQFFRRSLGELVVECGLETLWTEEQMDQIARIWHRLNTWPDSKKGINLLREEMALPVATLSNANTAILKDLMAHLDLAWVEVFGSDDFKAYKPNPKVYRGAAEKLGLDTNECAMASARLEDLWAARECGMKTIYVGRLWEEQWNEEKVSKAKEDGWVDMWIDEKEDGFLEVWKRLQENFAKVENDAEEGKDGEKEQDT